MLTTGRACSSLAVVTDECIVRRTVPLMVAYSCVRDVRESCLFVCRCLSPTTALSRRKTASFSAKFDTIREQFSHPTFTSLARQLPSRRTSELPKNAAPYRITSVRRHHQKMLRRKSQNALTFKPIRPHESKDSAIYTE